MKSCLLSYYFFHVSAKNWAARCRISSRCRWIPFSKLCTIDFILMCKCNGLQANPIRDSWCFSRPHKAPCARFEFHLTGLLHQIRFHAVIWRCRFKRRCRSRVMGAILCLSAASECTCFSFFISGSMKEMPILNQDNMLWAKLRWKPSLSSRTSSWASVVAALQLYTTRNQNWNVFQHNCWC